MVDFSWERDVQISVSVKQIFLTVHGTYFYRALTLVIV